MDAEVPVAPLAMELLKENGIPACVALGICILSNRRKHQKKGRHLYVFHPIFLLGLMF